MQVVQVRKELTDERDTRSIQNVLILKKSNFSLVCDKETAILHKIVVYIEGDFSIGGNDEFVCKLDVNYIKTDDYIDFPEIIKTLIG